MFILKNEKNLMQSLKCVTMSAMRVVDVVVDVVVVQSSWCFRCYTVGTSDAAGSFQLVDGEQRERDVGRAPANCSQARESLSPITLRYHFQAGLVFNNFHPMLGVWNNLPDHGCGRYPDILKRLHTSTGLRLGYSHEQTARGLWIKGKLGKLGGKPW